MQRTICGCQSRAPSQNYPFPSIHLSHTYVFKTFHSPIPIVAACETDPCTGLNTANVPSERGAAFVSTENVTSGCIGRKDIFCGRWLLSMGATKACWRPESVDPKQGKGRGEDLAGHADSSITFLIQRSSTPGLNLGKQQAEGSTATSPSIYNCEEQPNKV